MSETNQFETYYAKLNDEQKQAVDAIEGPVMAIAGAGTGKTQVLALRIAKILLETQINPQNILCLTFTESGVTAMQKRLVEIIGSTAYYVKIFTFHSFCNEIIQSNPEKFYFRSDFQQADDLEKIEFLNEILNNLPITSPLRQIVADPYFYQNDILSRIAELKLENIDPQKYRGIMKNLEEFLTTYAPTINNFTDIKGSPPEGSITTLMSEIEKLPQKNTEIEGIFLNFFQTSYQEYLGALTGEKRKDGTRRTALKNALKNIFTKALNNLSKQIELDVVYQKYQEKLRNAGRYDFEDMILYVTEKFQSDPALLRDYQERYQYILVDEYQDTNNAQNQTVALLASFFESPNLFVVGDDDQSIYRFQGASLENIINFYEQYKNSLKIITLTKNYRSQQTILDAATSVIQNNQHRLSNVIPGIQKDLISQTQTPSAKLKLAEFNDEYSEIYGIAKEVQKLLASGIEATEIAILYRNNNHSQGLIETFNRFKIPFIVQGGKNILEDDKINKLLILLSVVENPDHDDVLMNALFLDVFNFTPLDLLKLISAYNRNRRHHQTLFNFLSSKEFPHNLQLQSPENYTTLMGKIAKWKMASMNKVLPDYLNLIIQESGFLDYLESGIHRLEDLNRLNSFLKEAKNLAKKTQRISSTEFLKKIRLRQELRLSIKEEMLRIDPNAVQFMTAHSSKGLEFNYVFLMKCSKRVWGQKRSMQKITLPYGIIKKDLTLTAEEKEDDERRLFYVALTRAKKEIFLSYGKKRQENGREKEDLSSIFVQEINKDLIETFDTTVYDAEALDHQIFTEIKEPKEEMLLNEKAYLHGLLQNLVMTATGLNNYLTCPRKFFYQNVIKFPLPQKPSTMLGIAVHNAIDKYFKKYRKTLMKPAPEELLIEFKKSLNNFILTDEDYEQMLQRGRHILTEYYTHYQATFTPESMTEFNFSSHNIHLDNIPLTGKIDKVDFMNKDTQTVKVVDFKTGNPDNKAKKMEEGGDYWIQLIFYKILCDLSPVFKFKAQKAEVDFLERGRKSKHYIKHEIALTETAVDQVKNIIRVAWAGIQRLEFNKLESESEPCRFCDFKKVCWKKA